jgi:hypothetical protein
MEARKEQVSGVTVLCTCQAACRRFGGVHREIVLDGYNHQGVSFLLYQQARVHQLKHCDIVVKPQTMDDLYLFDSSNRKYTEAAIRHIILHQVQEN